MTQKSMRILLFALSVTLLVVVSARVSPGSSFTGDRGPLEEETWPTFEPTPELPPEPTPDPASEQTPNIRDILPGVSVTDWNLKLVNNLYILASSFAPEEVSSIRDGLYGQYIDSRVADALEAMLDGAEEAGYTVYVRAAYRPYQYQATAFFGRATIISENQGIEYAQAEEMARSIVAYPGTSEHQLGLCADIMDNKDTPLSADDVEDLPVLLWLREHCAEYGFIYRYPKEKQEITGWYEPWHFRYVGEECANYIMENGLCMEEFIDLFSM